MDSTAMQVITPLVAAGVSAYSPRYGGAGVQGGLAALRTLQERNYENQRIKIAQDREHQSMLDQQNQQTRFNDLLNGLRPKSSVGGASGNVPEATEALRSNLQDTGSTPQPAGFQPSDQELQLAAALGPRVGPQFLAQRFSSYQKEEAPSYQKAGHRVFGGYGSDTYVNPKTLQTREIATGPEDEKQTPENADLQTILGELRKTKPDATILDAMKARAQANQAPQQPGSAQFFQGSDGNMYALDPKNPTAPPKMVPMPTQSSPFGDVIGGSSSTAQTLGDVASPRVPNGKISLSKSGSANLFSQDDANTIADQIYEGKRSPKIQGLYRNGAAVAASLARRHPDFNQAQAELDFDATQKRLSSVNSAQQVRLQQSAAFAHESLGAIKQNYDQLRQILPDMGVRVFNRAALVAAQNLPGRAGELARTLNGRINDMTSELANVYQGGNTPTDHALSLAAGNLQGDWNEGQFNESINMIEQNLGYRLRSMQMSASPAGVSAGSPYGASRSGQGQQTQGGSSPSGGKQYVRTGTDAQGRRVGQLPNGQIEVIP